MSEVIQFPKEKKLSPIDQFFTDLRAKIDGGEIMYTAVITIGTDGEAQLAGLGSQSMPVSVLVGAIEKAKYQLLAGG